MEEDQRVYPTVALSEGECASLEASERQAPFAGSAHAHCLPQQSADNQAK